MPVTDYGYPLLDPKIERMTTALEAISTAVGGDVTETAIENALKSEGFAVGQQHGVDVESGSPYYENHSKYYSEQAAASAGEAQSAVTGLDSKAPKASPVFTGSISMGRKSGSTVGTVSVAVGTDVVASGLDSFSSGYKSSATGAGSHAEGSETTASGYASHAEGSKTASSGNSSHAEGYQTTANVLGAHAEGSSSLASEEAAHAEGRNSVASGKFSHAEGCNTTASGMDAHAEGYDTTASGSEAHAEGYGTSANHRSQHVVGEYNVADPSTASATSRGNYIEIIGNGRSGSARSNARTLDWSGNARYAGDVYVGCNADSSGGTKLAKMTDLSALIDDTAGDGDTDVAWSADKLVSMFANVALTATHLSGQKYRMGGGA